MSKSVKNSFKFVASIKARVQRVLHSDYDRRLQNEQLFFEDCQQVHDLPAIFHYWSNKYLLPLEQPFGITDPDQFFLLFIQRQLESQSPGTLRVASIGSGNCDLEVGIANKLVQTGHTDFTIECLDINQDMLDRGRVHADSTGVSEHIRLQRGDFNRWAPSGQFDIVMANQSLHHVLELEPLFDAIRKHLQPEGLFLTSDMIGRNGHQRWPEALDALQPFWDELPESHRFNYFLHKVDDQLMDNDCSNDGFEGIRAQDILPLLSERFHFELFIPFGNIIFPFIDRVYGPNFDPEKDFDRDFIDRVHAADEQGILEGAFKPTQMLAVLRNEPCTTQVAHPKLTPEFCIRPTDQL